MDEGAVIETAWRYFLREEMDVPFAGIVEFVRRQCPGVEVARVRAEFDRRLRERCGLAIKEPEEALEGAGRFEFGSDFKRGQSLARLATSDTSSKRIKAPP